MTHAAAATYRLTAPAPSSLDHDMTMTTPVNTSPDELLDGEGKSFNSMRASS
jgi:hypothetical protein